MCVSPFVFRYITFGVHTNCSSYISCFLFLAKRDYSFSNCNLLKYSCSAPTFFDMDLWKNNVYTVLPKDFFVRVCTPSIFHCYYIFFLPLILYLLSCFFLHLYRTFFFWTPQLICPLENQTQWRYYFVATYELHFSCAFFFFYIIIKTLLRSLQHLRLYQFWQLQIQKLWKKVTTCTQSPLLKSQMRMRSQFLLTLHAK